MSSKGGNPVADVPFDEQKKSPSSKLKATSALKPSKPPRSTVPKSSEQQKSRNIFWGSKNKNKKDGSDSNNNPPGTIGVEDIIDPTELATETLLMKSVEERDPTHKGLPENADIFPDVPVDIGHDFTLDRADGSVEASVAPSDNSSVSADNVRNALSKGKSRRMLPSARAAASRNLTVEQNLFGLSSALASIDEPDGEDEDEDNENNNQRGQSADRLAQTVNLLFNRKGSRSPSASASNSDEPTSAAGSRWGNLKANMNELSTTGGPVAAAGGSGSQSGSDLEAGRPSSHEDDDGGKKKKKRKNKWLHPWQDTDQGNAIKAEWDSMQQFINPRRATIRSYLRIVFGYLMLPMLAIAAFFFHVRDNPPTGKGPALDSKEASVSWYLIFGARQLVTFTMAILWQLLLVDFLALQTRVALRWLGPLATLWIVAGRGWPFIISTWAVIDFIVLAGDSSFARHWFFWQDWWGLFNEENPGGEVTSSKPYLTLLTCFLLGGLLATTKRVLVSLMLGRKTYRNYSKQLAEVMGKMLLISQVAMLARSIERKVRHKRRQAEGGSREVLDSPTAKISADDLTGFLKVADSANGPGVVETESLDALELIVEDNGDSLNEAQKARISELLGRWDEPPRGKLGNANHTPISAVLKFRQAVVQLETDFPFSRSFGIAATRDKCVVNAQRVFERLRLKSPSEGVLPFDILAQIALDHHTGKLDEDRVTALIRVFRPDTDGNITLLDFARSVDAVYKELRMLRATITNSQKIDRSIKTVLNIVFYGFLAVVFLSQTGYNPMQIFLSLSGIVIAFSFMIRAATSSFFEGVLFILLQKPYDIGDRVGIGNTEKEANPSGTQAFVVEDVTLYHTSFIFVSTNERATVSNGTLAKSRIINCGRSPNAVVFFTLKFGVAVPYDKIEIVRTAVDKFVKARPTQFSSLLGFRATAIQAELGYIEYCVVLMHREGWQNKVAILKSKAVIQQFCLELQKKLGIGYTSPHRPVDLTFSKSDVKKVPPPTTNTNEANDGPVTPNVASPTFGNSMEYLSEVESMFEGL